MSKSLTQIKRASPEMVLAGMIGDNRNASAEAGASLVRTAKDFGLSLSDYLKIAVDPRLSETNGKFDGLNGFEASLVELGLPFRNDFENGVLLQAASDAFQTYPGTRAMFPEVVDQMLRFKNRQDQIENAAALVAQSRTINGTELVSMAIDDNEADRGTYSIAEFGRIPVRTLRTSSTSVGIFKHGSGIKTSYEFERRVSLDILTPFAARVARELEISKVHAATNILLNGDGVNPAATAVAFSDYDGVAVDGANPLSKQYKAFAKWMVARAKAGTPIDTIVGNLDMYLELLFMFTPTLQGDRSEIESMSARGGPGINLNIPLLAGSANFVLSSSMPANKLLGYSKADTLEELIEAGSSISENERSIQNQSVTYVRSENTGYKIALGDTRTLLDLAA
jgi:hypothetical protein